MVVESNIRTRRHAVGLLGFQSAKGTLRDDLRLSADCIRVWSTKFKIPAAQSKSAPKWYQEKFSNNQADRYNVRSLGSGSFVALATPESVKAFVRSNWGPFSGSPATSTLTSVINEYATVAWEETNVANSTENLIRVPDCWLYRIRLLGHRHDNKLYVAADYEGRGPLDIRALNALAPVQLTAAPVTAGDIRVYNARNTQLIRDPAGLNIKLDFITFDLVIDQQVNAEWTMSDKWDIRKRGKTRILLNFEAKVADETWAIMTNNVSGTKERYQIKATSDGVTPSTLTIDLFNVDFEFENIGHEEPGVVNVHGVGGGFLSAQPPETGFALWTIS